MSVANLTPIQHRPFRGSRDPGLPKGIWLVQGSVLGDAGGGTLSFDILFKDGSLPNPESSLFYNIEQKLVVSSLDGGINVFMNPANWDEISPGATGSTFQGYALVLADLGLTNGSGENGSNVQGPLPWFLGQVRKNATNTIIRFSMANTAVSLAVKAEGYYWGPEAINAPGGPRRPGDSLYG